MSGTLNWNIDDDFMAMVALGQSTGVVEFVKDQGVYLMSGTYPDNKVCYANGMNPHVDDFDDWWDAARAICGGDDFVEALEASHVAVAVARNAKTFNIVVTEDELDLGFTA